MDAINRMLAFLDPDHWDYNYYLNENTVVAEYPALSNNAHLQDDFKLLPGKLTKHIFSFLNVSDLKHCRLVSHYWKESIRPIFQTKTCFILDGERYKWKFFLDGTCKSQFTQFMSTCSSKFKLWSSMRIRKVSTDQLNFLIANYEFGHAVKHISLLQFVECQLEWKALMGFLRHFENLETLEDIKGRHFLDQPLMQRLMSFLRRNEYQTPNDLNKIIESESLGGGSSFWKLKSIRIVENDVCNSETEEIFSILNGRTGEIDEVELDIGEQTAAIESPHRQTEYWSNIIYCLRMKDVKKLTIKSSHYLHNGFSKRFFLYFSHWKCTPGTAFRRLTELTIDIKPIQLWKTFQDQFIPFVRTLKCLEKLSIQLMVMRESQENLLHALKRAIPKECAFQFGITIDDYGGLIAASQIQNAMMQPLYFDHLTTLDIVILTATIIEARELFPYDMALRAKFPKVSELTFSTKLTHRTSFYTYNLNIVIATFPNVTKLVIDDGTRKTDSSGCPSGAMISDDDMQLILQYYILLQKLELNVNMMFVSDTGMTGLTYNVVDTMVDTVNTQRVGYSFSNLKYLKYLSLEGLGNLITDKTALDAFNGLQHSLQYLKLSGAHKVTETGESHLKSLFSTSKFAMEIAKE